MDQEKEYQMMKEFIESNTDITLKFLMWQDLIMEPQVFTGKVEAEDADCEIVTINLDKDGNIA